MQDTSAVPGLDQWLDNQTPLVRETLRALGALLSGSDYESASRKPSRQDAWIAEQLGVDNLGKAARVHRDVGVVDTVRVGMALAGMGTSPGAVCGPRSWSSSDLDDAVEWITTEIMPGQIFTYPAEIALATSSLADRPVVLLWRAKDRKPSVQVIAADQAIAAAAGQKLIDRARRDHDPFRGGVWRMGGGSYQLELHARPRPALRREDVALAAQVWAELDLATAAVTTGAARMHDLGLGCRRGVLLAGPPGTGKSAAAEVIAAELAGACTVIYVDGRAAAYNMESITAELVLLGGPVLLVIEDLDLAVGGHRGGQIDQILGQFLAGMDAHRDEPILVIATTNTVGRLDPAAVRSARFDATIEIGYPDVAERERILAALCARVPGAVDAAVVAAAAPATATGADMREWVRRCVLAEGEVSTGGLVAAASGAPADLLSGAYL
ncbi:MAG: ATP-binding protein [Mycobacterium sp.]|nr:MAG: ATP-binding protein [Mycobacterium sp.]